MRKIVLVLAGVAAMVVAKTSQAKPACEWWIDGADKSSASLKEETAAVVTVSVPVKGYMKTRDGWSVPVFTATPQLGYAGTWETTKIMTLANAPGERSDSGPATFTVEGAQCANNARTFQITVEPKPVPVTPPPPPDPNAAVITHDEKSRIMDVVDNSRKGGNVVVAAGLNVSPNLPTTNGVGVGPEISIAGIVLKSFLIGLALNWQRTNIPIEPAIHPTVMGGTEDQWSAKARLAWSPDISRYFGLDLGGEFGYNGSHYSTTFVMQNQGGQVEHVMQRTQHSPVVGPWVRTLLCPVDIVCFYGQFSGEVTFNRSRTIGEGADATNGALTTPESGTVQFNPIFGFGLAVRPGGN